MPRRERPSTTTRSEHWPRVAADDQSGDLNSQVREVFGWSRDEEIRCLSHLVLRFQISSRRKAIGRSVASLNEP
jgi:hypothetical protein